MNSRIVTISLIAVTMFAFACSKKTSDPTTASSSEDSSSSGLAASAVGGAVSSSDSSGTVTMNVKNPNIWTVLILQEPAWAATSCPKITTASGSGCTNSGNNVDLTYSSCSFGAAAASWTGTLEVSLSTGAQVTCGTFPTVSTLNGSVQRQFVSSAGVPGSATRATSRGTTVYIDHATANLGNFDNQTIAANIGTGYGTKVTFNGSGARTAVQVRQRLYVTGGFDHSIDGSITLSESGTTRTASGTIKVYHNKAKVLGTSTFTDVKYNNTSCIPVSGSISTAFTAGANVSTNALGTALVGKTETLTFNSDGTGTYVDATGASTTVELTHCY